MSKREYYQIDETEFDSIMESYGFSTVHIQGTKEKVYDRRFGELTMRVYSSIEKGTARDCGEDAIRVCVLDLKANTGVMRNKRVNRIQTWKKNLENRLNVTIERIEMGKISPAPSCPRCGASMNMRKARKGPNKGNFF